jgi:hypothetical protein
MRCQPGNPGTEHSCPPTLPGWLRTSSWPRSGSARRWMTQRRISAAGCSRKAGPRPARARIPPDAPAGADGSRAGRNLVDEPTAWQRPAKRVISQLNSIYLVIIAFTRRNTGLGMLLAPLFLIDWLRSDCGAGGIRLCWPEPAAASPLLDTERCSATQMQENRGHSIPEVRLGPAGAAPRSIALAVC